MSELDDYIQIRARSKKKLVRIRPWVTLATALIAILVQVYVPLYFPILRHLEFPLLVTLYLSIVRRGPLTGALTGAFIGILQDSLSHHPLGIFGLIKTLIGYAAASLGVRLDTDNPIVRLALCFFFFCVHQVLYWTARLLLLNSPAELDPALMLLAALANGVVGAVLFDLLDKLRDRE